MKKLYATSNYKYLLDGMLSFQMKDPEISKIFQGPSHISPSKKLIEGSIIRKTFPDGESYHRIGDSVAGANVVLIGGTISDSETLELFDLGCSFAKNGAKSLTIIIPFFGYSTMERAVTKGEVVKAKTRARLLSAIPQTTRNRIIFIDLHSEGIPHYLEGGIQPIHLYGKKLIASMCLEAADGKEFVLGSTDAGRAKWVESLANDMGVSCAVVIKRRISGSKTEVAGINADVKDKIVVIYDDMIRTGSSLIHAAEAYKIAGAKEVYAVATHGVFPTGKAVYTNDSICKLYQSGMFKKIFVTNTHPMAIWALELNASSDKDEMFKFPTDFLNVRDVSPLLTKYLHRH